MSRLQFSQFLIRSIRRMAAFGSGCARSVLVLVVLFIRDASAGFADESGGHVAVLSATLRRAGPLPERQAAAAKLLMAERPEGEQAVRAVLASGDLPAVQILCDALRTGPAKAVEALVPTLASMLAGADRPRSELAAEVLVVHPTPLIVAELRRAASASEGSIDHRAAAIQVLERMCCRSASEALVNLFDDPDSSIRLAALAAFERSVGEDFGADDDAARSWWAANRETPDEGWSARFGPRVLRQSQDIAGELALLRDRLASELREEYLSAAPERRRMIASGYLDDPVPAVRATGLELLRSEVTEGMPVTADLGARVRSMLQDPSVDVVCAAVRAVVAMREPADAARLLSMIDRSAPLRVRKQVVSGLGHVGSEASFEPLCRLLQEEGGVLRREAVGALARGAERGVFSTTQRNELRTRLLSLMQSAGASGPWRESLIDALGRFGDESLLPEFVAAAEASQPVAIRRAALRAISMIDTPRAMQALSRLAGDADAAIRRSALETLGRSTHSEIGFESLWRASLAMHEPDAGVRAVAWTAVLRRLATRPYFEIGAAVNALPRDDVDTPARSLELTELALAKVADGPAFAVQRVRFHAARAAALEIKGDLAAARLEHLAALREPQELLGEPIPERCIDALSFGIRTKTYDRELGEALRAAVPDADRAWDCIEREILQRPDADIGAVASAIAASAPIEFTEAQFEKLRRRIEQASGERTSSQPASRPASAPSASP